MATLLPLDQMSTEDKLRALEEIWEDLARAPGLVPAPQWHADVLRARERRIQQGEATFEQWTTVKQRLRDRTQ